MDLKQAYLLVFNDLINNGPDLLKGIYDARNKKPEDHYMYGITTVMEYIAATISGNTLKAYTDMWINNLIASEDFVKNERY